MWIDTDCAYCGEPISRWTHPSWEKRRKGPDRYCGRDCANKGEVKGAVKAQAERMATDTA